VLDQFGGHAADFGTRKFALEDEKSAASEVNRNLRRSLPIKDELYT